MAEIYGLKPEERTGDQAGTWKWAEANDTDYWADSLLANPALPPIWSATATYTTGQQVFYAGEIYTAIADRSATTTTPNNDSANWQRTGASVQEVRSGPNSGLGSRSVRPTNGAGLYRFRFNTNEVAAGEATEFVASTDNANTGGNDVLITLNHPPIPTSTGPGGNVNSVGTGNGLTNLGTATNPIIADDYADPETLVRLISQATDKTLVFDANGLPDTASVTLQPANGSTNVSYFVDYTFTNGLPSMIQYYEGTDNTGTLRAVKRLTFSNGLPQQITIGAT